MRLLLSEWLQRLKLLRADYLVSGVPPTRISLPIRPGELILVEDAGVKK
jgi:hypothetical protein